MSKNREENRTLDIARLLGSAGSALPAVRSGLWFAGALVSLTQKAGAAG